jgi:tol-pal system protein YbgF
MTNLHGLKIVVPTFFIMVSNMFARAFLLLFLMGCNVSYAGLFGDGKAREQISVLQGQVEQMEARIAKMEETLNSQGLLELYTQVETLGREMGELRGQIEVLTNQNELLQKRQRDFYIDLDNRLRRIEDPNAPIGSGSQDMLFAPEVPSQDSAMMSAPVVSPESSPEPSPITNTEPASPDENSAYDQAYNLFRNGDYSGAILRFEAFVASHPESNLAPAAAYWIGNAHYALRNFSQSIDAQNKLILTYPSSAKIPDALLNIASSQQEMGEKAAAKATLQDLIARYPFSDAADKAKRRLAAN